VLSSLTEWNSWIRLLLAALGLILFAVSTRRSRRFYRVALAVVAVFCIGAYFQFFLDTNSIEFHLGETYTYYMGSKYFDELGYFGLYECTVAAFLDLANRTDVSEIEFPPVRDLRTLERAERETLLAGSRRCHETFSPDRWASFTADVHAFRSRTTHVQWRMMLVDQGFNPPPVWLVIGGRLAEKIPANARGFRALLLVDRLLLGVLLGVVGWGFGLEIACVVAIIWGTGELWSHGWVGESYLRMLWITATIGGLAALRKDKPTVAGALFGLATALRLFPAVFPLAYLLAVWRRQGVKGWLTGPTRRFLLGAVGTVLLLVAGSLAGSSRGIDSWIEFGEKMRVFMAADFSNTLGLPIIARDVQDSVAPLLPEAEPGHIAKARVGLFLFLQIVRIGVMGVFLVALWRTLGKCAGWEAAAVGFTAVPLLTAAANYYYTFVLAAGLLATHRPRIGILLFAAALLWIGLGLVGAERMLWASLVAVIFCFLTLHEMRRDGAETQGTDIGGRQI